MVQCADNTEVLVAGWPHDINIITCQLYAVDCTCTLHVNRCYCMLYSALASTSCSRQSYVGRPPFHQHGCHALSAPAVLPPLFSPGPVQGYLARTCAERAGLGPLPSTSASCRRPGLGAAQCRPLSGRSAAIGSARLPTGGVMPPLSYIFVRAFSALRLADTTFFTPPLYSLRMSRCLSHSDI